ncbi:hypothetical protein [Sporisorium scitamineum]|uniref:Uncharacterized protein n=1 Tax=Sporisorium scitamineum TaxID=49012 RepID=A0A0F7RS19_9BASI|nr:hypothetical protein [Sporisorium scitamineum]
MTATYRTTLRTVAAAVSRASVHGPAARTKPQRLAHKGGQQLCHSSSATSPYLHTAGYAHPVGAQTDDALGAEPVRVPISHSGAEQNHALVTERHEEKQQLQALRDISIDKLLRLIAPGTYSGDYREAQNLGQALSGVEEWGGTTLAAPAVPREKLQISTPSEISDALALLHASISYAQNLARNEKNLSSFKALRHCSTILSRLIIQADGDALHLLPRSTDLLLALLNGFPAQSSLLVESISDYVRRCTGVPDERARQAVTRILDWLKSQKDSDTFDKARRNVLRHCIHSTEVSMTSPPGKTASSQRFMDFELMERLLRQDYGADSDLEQRALRCSVFVSGHACNHGRIWQSFNVYQGHKQKHGLAMTGSDYQLLSKALIRSGPGRKEAWHVFLQAERLWRRDERGIYVSRFKRMKEEKNLAHTCIDLLHVMAKSPDVRLGKVCSLLGVFLEGSDYWDGKPTVTGDWFSEAMLQRRADVRAYAVVMHGLLSRKRPKCALTVWQAMLQRGVMPNAVALSLLLQHLFLMRNVRGAMEQLHLWCEQGVPSVMMHQQERLKDIEVSSLSTSELPDTDTLLSGTLPSGTGHSTKRHVVTPDVVLATVVFSGLYRCGSQGVEALWDAYQLTIQRFPDAPVLAMLLKASCPDEATQTIDARFGRQVFRSLLFRKHPELAECRNPLNEQLKTNSTAGWIFSDNTVGSKVEEWIGSVFQPKMTAFASLPVDAGDLGSLVFTSKLFEHYLRLVLHLYHSSGAEAGARALREELIDLLGWMKELHVTPSPTHLALTVLEIEEHLPPAVAARQMDALEAWLSDWLGEQALPEPAVMQRHWRWKVDRNGQRKGWFDRIARPRDRGGGGDG